METAKYLLLPGAGSFRQKGSFRKTQKNRRVGKGPADAGESGNNAIEFVPERGARAAMAPRASHAIGAREQAEFKIKSRKRKQ